MPGGRKRHILVDTLGLLLEVIVTEANDSERVNGLALLLESQENLDRLELIWVDQGYQEAIFRKAVASLSCANVEVIKREGKGFQRERECVLVVVRRRSARMRCARRWVVERTMRWLIQKRRLIVDYEKLPEKTRIFNLYCNGSFDVQTFSSE